MSQLGVDHFNWKMEPLHLLNHEQLDDIRSEFLQQPEGLTQHEVFALEPLIYLTRALGDTVFMDATMVEVDNIREGYVHLLR